MKKKIFPVIHLSPANNGRDDLLCARSCGADGVFLISHDGDNSFVLRVVEVLKAEFPDFFIGINLLGITAANAVLLADVRADAVWTDNMELGDKYAKAVLLNALQRRRNRDLLHFGGFDFKYQKPNPPEEARDALDYCHVLTTSGAGTGSAPSLEKLKKIRRVINDFPLAIASGVSAENIKDLSAAADYFLVSSSITTPEDKIDPTKLERLVQNLH